MTETDEELEALREQTETSTRIQQPGKPTDEFLEDLDDALEERMASGAQRSVGLWDGELAALIDAIEQHPDRLERFASNAREVLGVQEDDELDRSDVVRLGVLYAIHDLDPVLWEEWRDAVAEYHRGV